MSSLCPSSDVGLGGRSGDPGRGAPCRATGSHRGTSTLVLKLVQCLLVCGGHISDSLTACTAGPLHLGSEAGGSDQLACGHHHLSWIQVLSHRVPARAAARPAGQHARTAAEVWPALGRPRPRGLGRVVQVTGGCVRGEM